MSKPTIVIVPGAWVCIPNSYRHGPPCIPLTDLIPPKHVPAHFSKVTKLLENAGYECVGVELPCNSTEPYIDGRLVGIDDDLAVIRKTVLSQLEAGHVVFPALPRSQASTLRPAKQTGRAMVLEPW
jgi:hypothetical protein